MRYILATIFACTIGMPAAFALPAVGPNSLSTSKAGPMVQMVKRNHPSSQHSRKDNGIHPLVGSGDY